MNIRIHRSYRNVVSLCDSNLLGKKFEQGDFQLDVRENFYKGEEVDSKRAIQILEMQALEDATFNIVGPESINVAIEAGIIEQNAVSKIDNVPFTLVLV